MDELLDKSVLLSHAPLPYVLGLIHYGEVYVFVAPKAIMPSYYVIDAAGRVEDPGPDYDEIVIYRVYKMIPISWMLSERCVLSVRGLTMNVYADAACENCTMTTWRLICLDGYIRPLASYTDEQLLGQGFRRRE